MPQRSASARPRRTSIRRNAPPGKKPRRLRNSAGTTTWRALLGISLRKRRTARCWRELSRPAGLSPRAVRRCSAAGPGREWHDSAARFEIAQERLRRRRAPQVRRDFPFARDPGVVDLVDIGEPLDPRAPGIRVVVEEVRADGVTAQAPPGVASPAAHPVGTERDRVNGRHLETGVMKARMAAGDESEDVMVAWPGVEEGHETVDSVTHPEAEHVGVEAGHLDRKRGEQ